MEDQNLNLPAAMSPTSTQDGSETNNNVPVATEVATIVDVGSDTGAKSGHAAGSNFPPVKRGRGRPRKHEVRVNQPALVPVTPAPELAIQPIGSGEKRGRGRPRGSGKLQMLASIGGCVAETAGGNFTPHMLTVSPGEDVVARIFAFFRNAPKVASCVISAAGTVSSVILRQPNSGVFVRHEGHFEILSLRGSCTFTSAAVAGGAHRKISMLSVSLAKSDGTIFGGSIENSMIAATPIPLIMATFIQSISQQIKRKYSSPSSTAPNMLPNSKAPKLTLEQGEPSCQTGNATANSNGVAVAVADINVTLAEATNAVSVSENVTTIADENAHSDSVGGGGGGAAGFDLESQVPESDNKTSP